MYICMFEFFEILHRVATHKSLYVTYHSPCGFGRAEALFGTGFRDLHFSIPGQADVPLLSLVNPGGPTWCCWLTW